MSLSHRRTTIKSNLKLRPEKHFIYQDFFRKESAVPTFREKAARMVVHDVVPSRHDGFEIITDKILQLMRTATDQSAYLIDDVRIPLFISFRKEVLFHDLEVSIIACDGLHLD